MAINSQKGASKFVNSHQPKKHNCKINKKQVLQAKEYLSVRLVSRGDKKLYKRVGLVKEIVCVLIKEFDLIPT